MAVHAKHSVSAPPSAPVRETTGHLMLRAYCTFVIFTAFAGSMWNTLLGSLGLGILIAVLAAISIALSSMPRLLRRADAASTHLQWRRLPWFPLAYVAWALASVLWTHWLDATLITWGVLAGTTVQALFVASMLTWRELVRSIASALKWVMGLSIVLELWAALVSGPILPNFTTIPENIPKELYWTRALLFDGGRIQGILGNSNLLGIAALVAIIVFAIRIAVVPRRGWLIAWTVLSAFLLLRAASATTYLAAAGAVVVLATALIMRTARRPGQRTRWYLVFFAAGAAAAAVLIFFQDALFGALGRSDDLTGRQHIWDAVLERAWGHPVVGWGFTTPWLPWEPEFDHWIVDHSLTVFMAHSVWIDVFFQLGFIGVALIALMYLAYMWRSWFFAVDRPRWDLTANRPYSALTLLPLLIGAVVLVQGVSESRPLMEWGWLMIVMLAFKIKQSPLVGVGAAEQSLAIERGQMPKQATTQKQAP